MKLLLLLSICTLFLGAGVVTNQVLAQSGTATTATTPEVPYKYDKKDIVKTPSGLQYVIVEKGKGEIPQKGAQITAHYHGMLENGKVFDSSFNRGTPFSTKIGVGQVIKGWDEAFTAFPVGTKAVIIIPPNLGYGSQDKGVIPPNSTLIFHVHLIK